MWIRSVKVINSVTICRKLNLQLATGYSYNAVCLSIYGPCRPTQGPFQVVVGPNHSCFRRPPTQLPTVQLNLQFISTELIKFVFSIICNFRFSNHSICLIVRFSDFRKPQKVSQTLGQCLQCLMDKTALTPVNQVKIVEKSDIIEQSTRRC